MARAEDVARVEGTTERKGPGVRPWLPPSVIADRLPTAALSAILDRWAADWLPVAEVRVGRWERGDGPGDDLILSTGRDGSDAVAQAMFGSPPEPLPEADRAKLDRATAACVDDLRRRLVELFGSPVPVDRVQSRHGCAIDLPDRPGALRLSLSDTLLAGWIRASLPMAAARPPVSSLARALDAQTIRLSALVGRCRLTLRELEGWAVGDVLVLDRPLDEALDLLIGGRPCADAPCRLVDAGDELHLVLS